MTKEDDGGNYADTQADDNDKYDANESYGYDTYHNDYQNRGQLA